MDKKVKYIKWGMFSFVIILAVFFNPIFTLLFALKADLFESSLSKIGNSLGYRAELIIFCIAISLFFIVTLTYLFILTKMKDKTVVTFLCTTCILLTMTGITPFMPSKYPNLAEVHNGFAVGAVICALVTLVLYAKTLKNLDSSVYKRAIVGAFLVFIISLGTFIAVGMCSFIEVVFVYAVCIYLFLHICDIYHSKKIDVDNSILKAINYFKDKKESKKASEN